MAMKISSAQSVPRPESFRGWHRAHAINREKQLAVAAEAARLLHHAGAKRVWLFGSVAKGRRLGVHSDFDFAIEGLPPERYFGCLGALLQRLPLPVDLVELESASEMLRQRVLAEGIEMRYAD